MEKGTKRPGRKEGRYVDMGKKCLLYIERMVEGPGVNLKGISRQNMSWVEEVVVVLGGYRPNRTNVESGMKLWHSR